MTNKLPNGTVIKIRKLEKGDLSRVVDILNNSADKLSQDRYTLEGVRKILSNGTHFYVAKVEGTIVGCISLKKLPGKMSHVGCIGITVDEPYRRKGIGTTLLKTIFEISRKIGLKKLTTEVMKNNAPAIKMFAKLGSEREGVLKRHIRVEDEYVDLICMRKFI